MWNFYYFVYIPYSFVLYPQLTGVANNNLFGYPLVHFGNVHSHTLICQDDKYGALLQKMFFIAFFSNSNLFITESTTPSSDILTIKRSNQFILSKTITKHL